jgi:hypothetical protein
VVEVERWICPLHPPNLAVAVSHQGAELSLARCPTKTFTACDFFLRACHAAANQPAAPSKLLGSGSWLVGWVGGGMGRVGPRCLVREARLPPNPQ